MKKTPRSRSLGRSQVRRSCRSTPRNGVAPLEYVMALPLLIALIYSLFCLIRVTLHGMDVVEQARYETFQGLNRAAPASPMTVLINSTDGAVERLPTRPVQFDGWYAAANTQVRSGNKALGGTWDFAQVTFDNGGTPFTVHRVPLTLICQDPNVGTVVFYFTQLLSQGMYGLPAIGELANVFMFFGNGAVTGAGWYLYGLSGGADSVADALDIANKVPFTDLDSEVSTFRFAQTCFYQSFRATQGCEVEWPADFWSFPGNQIMLFKILANL